MTEKKCLCKGMVPVRIDNMGRIFCEKCGKRCLRKKVQKQVETRVEWNNECICSQDDRPKVSKAEAERKLAEKDKEIARLKSRVRNLKGDLKYEQDRYEELHRRTGI